MDQINNISAEATTSFSNKLTELDNYRQYQEENNYNVKSRSEESDNHSSVSSTETSPISSDGEDQDVQEAASENNGWVTGMPTRSLEHGNQQVNPIDVPAREHSSFGDVRVEKSDNVHVGSRSFYKGPVTINQYLYNNSTVSNENQSVPKSDDSNDCNIEVIVEEATTSLDKENRILSLLKSQRFKLIIGVVTLLAIILIIVVAILLLNNSNDSASIKVPSMPTGPLDIKQLDADSVMITWGKPEDDGGAPLCSFEIEKKDTSDEFWTGAAEVKPNINNVTINSLLGGHEYCFRVFAQNKVGFSVPLMSETPLLMKQVPSSPQKPLDINQTAEGSVSLRWRQPEHDGKAPIQEYHIHVRDVNENEWFAAANASANYLNATVEELQNDHKYLFRIYARNEVGLSEPLESEEPIIVSDYPDLMSREEWQALPSVWPPVKLKILPASHVIICSTLTGDCSDKASCIDQVQVWQNYSISSGLGDIKYNFLIGGDGLVYEGRNWDIEGNHTTSYNNKSIGIAFLGDYFEKTPTDKQMFNLKRLLQYGFDYNKLDKDYKLIGQKQVASNPDSPGYAIMKIIQTWEHYTNKP